MLYCIISYSLHTDIQDIQVLQQPNGQQNRGISQSEELINIRKKAQLSTDFFKNL